MRLLVDTEIAAALHNPAANALAYVLEGDPPQHQAVDAEQAQSTSLDLTIGEIFIPGTAPDDVGGSRSGKSQHNLDQGHTAVIRTREFLRMGPRRAAVAFPPSRVSLKGLLMTNPGHIDPGYEGQIHCTVINMGHESYALSRGDRIMRALIFQLDNAVQATPAAGVGAFSNPVTSELLARLSVDFVDVQKRAQSIADGAVSKATWRSALISASIPIATALVTVIGAVLLSPLQSIKDDIVKLQTGLTTVATKLEEKSDVNRLDSDISTLKVQFGKEDKFDERLKALENKLNVMSLSRQQNGTRR